MVVVVGMDGVLLGVVTCLVSAPVVGGADVGRVGGGGRRVGGRHDDAVLGSPGLVVVNIDEGFRAAVHAAKVVRSSRRG